MAAQEHETLHSHVWSRFNTSLSITKKQAQKEIYAPGQTFRICIMHNTHTCFCATPPTIGDLLPSELQTHPSFIDKNTGKELNGILPKKCILSSEKRENISKETFDLAEALGVDIYPKGYWTDCFLEMKRALFSEYSEQRICSDDELSLIINKVLKLSTAVSFQLLFYQKKISCYNRLRSKQDRSKWLPEILLIAETPVGITPCNILARLAKYSDSLKAKKDIKMEVSISITEVIQALPGIDITGISLKSAVEKIPISFRSELVANPVKAFDAHPELQKSTDLSLEDIADHKYPSVKLCDCGMAISDFRAYISSINTGSLSFREGNKEIVVPPCGYIKDAHKKLYIKCMCCPHGHFSWNSLKTK